MNNEQFEEAKRRLIEENEQKYGQEARERFGEQVVDQSNQKMLGLTQEEFTQFQELGTRINRILAENVQQGVDARGEAGNVMYELHRKWLSYTWNFYTPEAHCGLAEGYLSDSRFQDYYDSVVPGCVQWLRDAIVMHARQ